MDRRTKKWPAALVFSAVAATGTAAGAQTTRVDPAAVAAPAPAGDALFSAEVTVERAVVNEKGTVIRDLPRSRYRIEHFTGGRSRMAMLPSAPGPRVGPLADPYAGMVVEFDPAGAGLRLLGRDGQPVPGAPPLPAGLVPPELGQGRHDGLVTPRRERDQRRADLTRQFGTRAGTVRQLERYVDSRGARWQEVLVEPATALPVEVNVVQDGRLDEHHEFSYDEPTPGHLVRTRTRSETRVPGAAERLIAVTTLAHVRVSGGVE